MGIAIQNEGDMCACNVNAQSYQLDGKRQTIDKITIDQIWDSPTRKEIANMLDNDIRNPGCKACWDDEDAGVQSSRQFLNSLFMDKEPIEDQPRVMIIKPGNSCNAACRACRPETSTGWYRDGYELNKKKQPDISFNEYIKRFEDVKNSFNPKSNNLWPTLNNWYENILFLDIYGGEPWMIPGVWESLQVAIDKGYSKNISLQFHTNLSWWNEDYNNILKNFKHVRIGMSIDSHNKEEAEYIRHKINFNTAWSNAKKFIELARTNDNIDADVCVTIMPFNIWNLDKTYEFINEELVPKDYYIDIGISNFVYSPTQYDIRHLPKEIKQLIADKFKNYSPHPNKFDEVLQYMNQIIPGCVIHWPQFCLETEKLDKIRNTSFKEVFPEWYKVLEPYWDYRKSHHEWYGSCSL